MTTDFRALCAELLAAADEYAGMNPYMRLDNAMKTARAALAAEPVPPADGEAEEPPEAPIWLNNAEAAAWQSGWTCAAADLLERLAESEPTTSEND